MKPRLLALLAVVVVAVSVAGCRQANPVSPSDTPLIVDFAADAYTIAAGSVVMLLDGRASGRGPYRLGRSLARGRPRERDGGGVVPRSPRGTD